MGVCNEQHFIDRHRRSSSYLPLGFVFAVVEGDSRGVPTVLPCICSCVEAKGGGQNVSLEKFHLHLTCKEK